MKKLNSYQRKALRLFFASRLPLLRAEYSKQGEKTGKRSTGIVGKFAEGLRIILNSEPTDIMRCRAANRTDIRIGRNVLIEVKTGSGAVAYAEDTLLGYFTPEDLGNPDLVLKGCNHVLWMPFPPMVTETILNLNDEQATQALLELVLKNSWLFTRDEFLNLLNYMGKNGLRSMLKLSKQPKQQKIGYQINIQSIGPVPESKFWDAIAGKPTAYEVLL